DAETEAFVRESFGRLQGGRMPPGRAVELVQVHVTLGDGGIGAGRADRNEIVMRGNHETEAVARLRIGRDENRGRGQCARGKENAGQQDGSWQGHVNPRASMTRSMNTP